MFCFHVCGSPPGLVDMDSPGPTVVKPECGLLSGGFKLERSRVPLLRPQRCGNPSIVMAVNATCQSLRYVGWQLAEVPAARHITAPIHPNRTRGISLSWRDSATTPGIISTTNSAFTNTWYSSSHLTQPIHNTLLRPKPSNRVSIVCLPCPTASTYPCVPECRSLCPTPTS